MADREQSFLKQACGFIIGTVFGGFALQYWVYPEMDKYFQIEWVKGTLVFASWVLLLFIVAVSIQGWPWAPRKRAASGSFSRGEQMRSGGVHPRSKEFSILTPSIPRNGIWVLGWIEAQPTKVSIDAFHQQFETYIPSNEERDTILDVLSRHALIVRTKTTVSVSEDGAEFLRWVDTGKH